MEEGFEIVRGTLSERDKDVLSGMMTVFTRSMEKCVSTLETNYALEYMAGEQYNILKKEVGKIRADMIVKEQVRKIVRGDERNKIGKILKIAGDFHKAVEGLLDNAMTCHYDDVTDVAAFDGIQNDSNWLCYFYAMVANCESDSDGDKILEYVQYLATGDRVSKNLLDKLKINNQNEKS